MIHRFDQSPVGCRSLSDFEMSEALRQIMDKNCFLSSFLNHSPVRCRSLSDFEGSEDLRQIMDDNYFL